MGRSQGVTLVEALSTLAVIGILSAVAVPSFTGVVRDGERSAAVNAFFHAVFLARSESIKRVQVVSICKSRDGATCAEQSAAWHDGWVVFVDDDRDGQPRGDAAEPILLVNRGWQNGTITSNRQSYSFRPYQQAVVNGTIVFCDSRGSAHARAIVISFTGRPRIAEHGTGTKPLPCT